MVSDEGRLSQHPLDRLIRALIRREREAESADVELILERIEAAPFDPRPELLRSHLATRKAEGQWRSEASTNEFVEDLHRAVRSGARLALYARRGGHIALLLAETGRVIPESRLASQALPLLAVIYSADRGSIISGYQATSLARVTISEEVLWLA